MIEFKHRQMGPSGKDLNLERETRIFRRIRAINRTVTMRQETLQSYLRSDNNI